MGTFDTSELQGFKPPAVLNKAWYDLMVFESKTKDGRWQLGYIVTDGPEQEDGSSPVGRKFYEFMTVAGFSKQKDGGTYAKTLLFDRLNAFQTEIGQAYADDHFMNKEVKALVKPKKNQDGIEQESIVLIKAAE